MPRNAAIADTPAAVLSASQRAADGYAAAAVLTGTLTLRPPGVPEHPAQQAA